MKWLSAPLHGGPAVASAAAVCLAACLLVWSDAVPASPEAQCFEDHDCLNRIPDRDPQRIEFKDNVDSEGYLYGPCSWHKWGGCFHGSFFVNGPDVGGVLDQYEENIETQSACACDVQFERAEDWVPEGASHDTTCGRYPVVSSEIETQNRQIYRIYQQCSTQPEPAYFGWFIFKRQRLTTCPPGTQDGKVPGTGIPTCRVQEEAPLRNTGACPKFASGAAPAMSPIVSNPVNAATGNKYQRETDYTSPVASGLRFRRHYNSERLVRPGVLGRQWRHTYERSVERVESTVGVWREDGRALFFTRTLGGQWRSRPGTVATLTEQVDASASLVGWEYRPGDDSVERYDVEGRLVSITARGAFTQTLTYDADGRLATVTGPFGRILTFGYAGNNLERVVDPAGGVIRFEYVGGMLSRVAYPDATPAEPADDPVRRYHYEDPAFPRHLTGITDERGVRSATWRYDDVGRAVSSEHADGADRMTFAYNADGTTTVVDALGHERGLAFELNHGIWRTSETTGGACASCSGGVQSTEVNANGFLARSVSYNGHVSEYVHDDRGLEISRIEASGSPVARTIATQWHSMYRVPVRIEAPGKTTTFVYDDAGRLLSRTEVDSATGRTRTVDYTYDAEGLLVEVDGPRTDVDDIARMEYVDGVVSRIVNALGHETRITEHDAHGRPLRVLDPNGLVTEFSYDARGRLTSRTLDGLETLFEYDPAGNLVRTVLPDGGAFDVTLDAAARVVSVVDAAGNQVDYDHDAMGNRTGQHLYGPGGVLAATEQQVFDVRGRLVERIGGDGQRRAYEYDLMDNLVAAVDGQGRATTHRYDALERLIETVDPLQGTTGFAYDARDNLVAVTDPRGLTTGYTIDGLGDTLGESSPDRGERLYDIDASGNRIAETDGRGITAMHTYDALNRVTAVRYPTPGKDVTYTYDTAPNGIGRLATASDESGTTRYEYDRRGNVLVEERVVAGEPFVSIYTYDAVDRVSSMTYPSGRTISYTRDPAGRITALHLEDDGEVTPLATDVRYDGAGRMVGWTLGNGHVVNQRFDLSGRMTDLDTPGVLERTYTHDANDNVSAIEDLLNPAASQQFGYDALDRVTAAEGLYGPIAYEYDAVGNRTRRSQGPVTDVYGYGVDSNRLLDVVGPGGVAFEYDAAGNVVTRGDRTYTYGDTGRLETAHLNGVEQARYRYNAAGERSVRDDAGTRTRYVFDRSGQMIMEVEEGTGKSREYVYLGGRPLAVLEKSSPLPQSNVYVGQGVNPETGVDVEVRLDADLKTLNVWEGGVQTVSLIDVELHLFPEDGYLYARGASSEYSIVALHLEMPQGLGNEYVRESRLSILGPYEIQRREWIFDRRDEAGRFHSPVEDPQKREAVLDETAKRFTVFTDEGAEEFVVDLSGRIRSRVLPYEGYRVEQFNVRTSLRSRILRLFTYDGETQPRSASLHVTDDLRERREYRSLTATWEISAGQSSGQIYYYHTDHLGTPQALTDKDGSTVWKGDYLPFGEVVETIANVEQGLRFPGQHADEGAGGYYNYQRIYEPTVGRYLTSDPIGLTGGMNTYTYVGGNSVRFVDRYGESAAAVVGGWIGADSAVPDPTDAAWPKWIIYGAALGGATLVDWLMYNRPPSDAADPDGAKAPGKPGEAEGYKDPKGGEDWVPNPNPGKGGGSHGWKDRKGRVWVPTGKGGRAHGGPHWDVQLPDGTHINVPPGTHIDDCK